MSLRVEESFPRRVTRRRLVREAIALILIGPLHILLLLSVSTSLALSQHLKY